MVERSTPFLAHPGETHGETLVLLLPLLLLQDTNPDLAWAILAGRLTLNDARALAAGISDLDDLVLGSRYDECHRVLVARCEALGRNVPPITAPCASLEALEAELTLMPIVADAFVNGKLTLVQARYAHRMALSADKLERFIARAQKKRVAMSAKPVVSIPPRRDMLKQLAEHPAHQGSNVGAQFAGTPDRDVWAYVQSLTSSPRTVPAQA